MATLTRQHGTPILLALRAGAVPLTPVSHAGDAVSEADIQTLIHAYPLCLPIAEIDPLFIGPVPICTELNTPAGPIDNFMVTPSGLPVLVECKLWRSPEARREVVSQILDYAKELSRWSSSDVQREVSRRLKRDGNPLIEMVRQAVDQPVDEVLFNDSLTANLRRGRFLLLIVGDGIREGVEAITEYLQAHAGLHFSLGLVELPIYLLPNGDRLVAPRVLARTAVIIRNVVALPDGYGFQEPEDLNAEDVDPERKAVGDAQQRFWDEFVNGLKLDDPEQPKPKPARQGYISLSLPARTSWLTVYRVMQRGEVGVFISSWRQTPGGRAMETIVEDSAIKDQLGGGVTIGKTSDGRDTLMVSRIFGDLNQPEARRLAFEWLGERVNAFVNVIRPVIRTKAIEFQSPSL